MTVVDARKDNFDELVGSGLVLVDVWAESCRPCVALSPHMESIADENPDLTVVKVDASKARRLVMSLQVRGLRRHRMLRLNGCRGHGPVHPGDDQAPGRSAWRGRAAGLARRTGSGKRRDRRRDGGAR